MCLKLKIKGLFIFLFITIPYSCLTIENDCSYTQVPFVTQPYSNDNLTQLLDQLPTYENDTTNCLINETCAFEWMKQVNYIGGKLAEKAAYLDYQYSTNLTDENSKLIDEMGPIVNKFNVIVFKTGHVFYANSKNWSPELRRMLFLTKLSDLSDPEVLTLTNQLSAIYAKAKVCLRNNTCLALEPDLTNIMANSRNYAELLFMWKGWRDSTGPFMKYLFAKNVDLQNEARRRYGYNDTSEQWIEEFETENFESVAESLYEQIKPLYQQLHAYTRRKLREFYGVNRVANNRIPAHLLGNMWAQSWENIYDLVVPYPNVKQLDVTSLLLEKGFTPLEIFKESERFFESLGLCPMTQPFWNYSMIVKPNDRDVQCHASASDLYNGYDFRIKMCTEVNDVYFATVHHEMGHIQYYMSYRNQPFLFKNGANSAFHEAIGDTIALSVFTTTHFKRIWLINDDTMSQEQTINFLMRLALQKVAFLPFGYLIDKWRWDVFRGNITPSNYNAKWWEYTEKYQGIESPIPRSENDFDPGSKYHVAANVPYARYFISFIIQFQFYDGLCKLAGHQGPLHTCDFYQSSDAGSKFIEMLQLGSSKHWKEAMKIVTGVDNYSTDSLIKYFQPLMDWLITENAKYPNETIGW